MVNLKCFKQFLFFSSKRTAAASAAKFTVLFCEKRDIMVSYDTSQAFDTHRVYNPSTTVIVKWSSIYKRYYAPHLRHLPRIAASREKNRATGIIAIKNRLTDYRLFRANYGTILQYCFLVL